MYHELQDDKEVLIFFFCKRIKNLCFNICNFKTSDYCNFIAINFIQMIFIQKIILVHTFSLNSTFKKLPKKNACISVRYFKIRILKIYAI